MLALSIISFLIQVGLVAYYLTYIHFLNKGIKIRDELIDAYKSQAENLENMIETYVEIINELDPSCLPKDK